MAHSKTKRARESSSGVVVGHRKGSIGMTSQEDRERFAPLFRYTRNNALGHKGWMDKDNWSRYAHDLPDFCDIRGPYFGPACEELTRARWNQQYSREKFSWVAPDEVYMEDMSTDVISDPDLGRCTMLALEAKRAGEVQP